MTPVRTSSAPRQQWQLKARAVAATSYVPPYVPDALFTNGALVELGAATGPHGTGTSHDRACRLLNLAVASLAIVLAAPLMLLVAVLVKLSSPGPVIFKQHRVGIDRRTRGAEAQNHRRMVDRGGRLFTIYKFRTMRDGADTIGQVWASENDPRITPVGRVLRAFRLDELPQLFNVLKGDMNIVGPRPEQPEIFATLRDELDHYRDRQRVLPGITGLAQVELGYDRDVAGVRRKVDLDLEYIQRRSAVEDLMIMAKTVPVMVLRKEWM